METGQRKRKRQRKAWERVFLTYMRREGLQGGDALLRVGALPFGEVGLQARAGLIHRHGPTGPRGLPAFQG